MYDHLVQGVSNKFGGSMKHFENPGIELRGLTKASQELGYLSACGELAAEDRRLSIRGVPSTVLSSSS
jgi:hypothetical protein